MADAAKGLAKFIIRIARLIFKLTKSVSSPSLENYFLWTAIFYTIIGVVAITFHDPVYQFFCNTPETLLESLDNCKPEVCGDKLLMCGKSPCWRYATNYTYLTWAKTPNQKRYAQRIQAAGDDECNDLVDSATGPVDMLSKIAAKKKKSGGSEPTVGCIKFNCQLMVDAVLGSELGIAPNNGGCTNEKNVKPDALATACPCNAELSLLNLQKLTDFTSLCGNIAQGLMSDAVFESILKASKEPCYAEAYVKRKHNQTANDFKSINNDVNCSFLTNAVDTAFHWFSEEKVQEGLNPHFRVKRPCKTLFCDVFSETLTSQICQWSSDKKLKDFSAADHALIEQECTATDFSKQTVCNQLTIRGWTPSWCSGVVTVTSPPTSPPGNVQIRRLAETTSTTLPPCGTSDVGNLLCGAAKSDGPAAEPLLLTDQTQVWTLANATSTSHRQAQQGQMPHEEKNPGTTPTQVAREGRLQHSTPTPAPLDNQLQDVPPTAQLERRLQNPAPAPAPSPDLQDYSTTAWSTCTCLFQCIDGVKTRAVVCPPGERCKEPKPSMVQNCVCGHCSKCMLIILKIIAYTSFGEVGFCLIAFLCFLKISKLGEDDFSEIGICTKIVGCCCRGIPCIVKSLVWVIMYMMLFLVFEVVVPNFQKDCSTSQNLKVATAIIAIVWGLQLLFGFTFKRFKKMPPWLHNPTTSNFMKMILAPLRAIGP